MPEIQAHPWYVADLNPAALTFNDALVADSLACATPDSVCDDIRSIVRDAQRAGPEANGLGADDLLDQGLGSMDLAAEDLE